MKVHDVHFPSEGASQMVVIQVEPTKDGKVTDALLASQGAPWANVKTAVAVDPDIDIHDYRDLRYALATRVDTSRHVTIVDNARTWPFDPSATPVDDAFPHSADMRLPSVTGKWGIDATKPVPYRAAEFRAF